MPPNPSLTLRNVLETESTAGEKDVRSLNGPSTPIFQLLSVF